MTRFERHNTEFYVEHVHTDTYRVGHRPSGTWNLLTAPDLDTALKIGIELIDLVWAKGEPNFYPSYKAYRVTGTRWDHNTNEIVPSDGISLRAGTHSRNYSGTHSVQVAAGEQIICDRTGEDYSFFYYDTKPRDPENSNRYADGEWRVSMRGSKIWSLLWSLEVTPV